MASAKQPSDHRVRAEAIDPSRSFLIQAPAGSGKTELLTDRILALLATVDRPEEIVAITFTRKAASEMHKRVMEKLRAGRPPAAQEDGAGGPAESGDEEKPHEKRSRELARRALARSEEKGWNILDYPARLAIRTIDSFCAHLARSMPWLSQLGGMPRITENAQVHYQAAAQATLSMVDDEPAVATLLAHLDVDGRAAGDLLATSLACRDQWMPLLGDGGDAALLSSNLDYALARDLEQLIQRMPSGWAAELAPCVRSAAQSLEQAGAGGGLDIGALREWDGAPFGADPETDLPRWQALARLLLKADGGVRARVTRTQGFEPRSDHKKAFESWLEKTGSDPAQPPWAAALHDVRAAPREYAPGQLDTLAALLHVLRLASAQLQLQFMQAGEVDFIEIAQRAVSALGRADDPSDLLLKLDASIRHILVDEFQDTSHSQIVLLETLTSGWTGDDGRTLFLVGDPMQSIYRFRKAEVGLFLKVRQEGLGHLALTPLRLTDNFRSDKAIVDWVNGTFKPLFPARDNPVLGAISYTPSQAYRASDAGAAVAFHPVWLPQDADAHAEQKAVDETESLVVGLVRDALKRHPQSRRPVAVLVRARSHLEGVLRRLADHGIACRAVELEPLKSRQVIDDLVQLARALSHDGDRLAWLCVLRSPMCGLTLGSLHALFGADHAETVPSRLRRWLEQGGGEPALAESEAGRLRRAAAVLLDQANRAGSVPFSAWLEQCWQRLGGRTVYRSPVDAADAEQLFRLIDRLAPYGGLDPFELEARLEGLYASSGGAGPAVQVMTVHKAKGLEFDTVVMMGLHRRPARDTAPLVRFDLDGERILLGPIKPRAQADSDPVSDYLARRDKRRADYETDRLLYVAATRACSQLHFVGTVVRGGDGEPRPAAAGSLLARLWPYLDVPAPPAGRPPEPQPGIAAQEPRHLIRLAHAAAAGAVPAAAGGRRMAWEWSAGAGDEAVIGSVAHAWLEYLGRHGIDQWSAQRLAGNVPRFKTQLSRAGVPSAGLDAAAEIVRETLAATLASATGRWLLSVAKGYREWSLVDASGRVSVIDLALSREDGWLVVDYKTGVPATGETDAHFKARMRERYADQIARYCAHLRALDGRPARGALYFPRADAWIDC